MNKLRVSWFFVLSLLGGAMVVSTDAGAQGAKGVFNRPQQVQRAAPVLTQNVANVMTDRQTGTSNAASNGALDGVPVLNGFHLKFSNGDHELRKVSVLVASPSSATIALIDKNADDPYRAEATWINIKGGGTRGEVHAAGGGQFDVPLPTQRPPNSRLVLTGFELRDQDDDHIRMVGVWLDETRNVARVSFLNHISGWFSAAGTRLGAAGVPVPDRIGAISSKVFPTAAAADAYVSANDNYSYRAFAVRLQYAFIPNTIVEGEDYFTGSSRAPSSGKIFQPRAAIQGFEFFFDNKAHHLLEIGVMPRLPGSAVSARAPQGEYIAFQDKNRDDPIKWAVKLLTIKP